MIGVRKVVSLFAGLVMLAGYATIASAADATEENAIRAVNQSWVKAYNAGDAGAIAALYADNALLMPPGAPAVSGPAAIKAFMTKDIAGSSKAGVSFALGAKQDVGFSGDLGWESGTYTVKIKGAVVETGKYLAVYKKKDGKWLLIRDTWNADVPPPAAPAAAVAPAAPAASAKPAAAAAPAAPAAPPKK
jgi:uncharacterized protein (TIGR02246 family)